MINQYIDINNIFTNNLQLQDCQRSYLIASKMSRLKLKTSEATKGRNKKNQLNLKRKAHVNTASFWQVQWMWEKQAGEIWNYD